METRPPKVEFLSPEGHFLENPTVKRSCRIEPSLTAPGESIIGLTMKFVSDITIEGNKEHGNHAELV